LYSSRNVIWVNKSRTRWVVHVARVGEMRSVYNSLVGNHERKRQLGRPRYRWRISNWIL